MSRNMINICTSKRLRHLIHKLCTYQTHEKEKRKTPYKLRVEENKRMDIIEVFGSKCFILNN